MNIYCGLLFDQKCIYLFLCKIKLLDSIFHMVTRKTVRKNVSECYKISFLHGGKFTFTEISK